LAVAENKRSMLECDEAREILWPMDRPREYVEGEEAARSHLERCQTCQAFFRRDAAITEALRRQGVHVHAPQVLRERVFDALARERALGPGPRSASSSAGWLSRFVPVGAAAAVTLAIAIGMLGTRGGELTKGGDNADRAYVQDFLSRAVEADVVEFPEPEAVTAFFMRELGVHVEPVAFEEGHMNRAMICLIEGERAAMVEYEMGGRTIAHYLVPAGDESVSTPDLHSASEGGLQVVSWSDDHFEHALVSDLSESDLKDLARTRFATR
jgi:anti-sigma factor RsiW